MTPARLLLVLKSRWPLVLLVWGGVVAVTAVLTALQPRTFTATAMVMVDPRSADPLNNAQNQPLQADAYMAAQVDILQSERVGRHVISALNLAADDKDAQHQRWRGETGGQGDYVVWLAEAMRKQLDIRPAKESGVIKVGYSAPDRDEAARIANAYVQAYADVALQLRVEPARQHSAFFDERSRQLRERLEVAQNRLSEFQRSSGLVGLGQEDRLDIESARLSELSTQLTQLQALAGESGSRQAQASDRSPEVVANGTIANLNGELARQQARLSEMTTRLGDQHPSIVELRANVAQLRSQVASETRRVTGSLGVNNAVNQQRISQTRAALDAQRAKVLQLTALRDEAAVLRRDVQNAQAAYDSLGTRVTQALLESQSNLTNISVLKAATPPVQMSSRQFAVNLPVALLLGGVLAIAVAMLRESRDRRLRSADDVTEALALPLLAEIPRARIESAGGGADTAPAPLLQRLGMAGARAGVVKDRG